MPHGNEVHMKSLHDLHMYEHDGKTYPSVTTVLQCVAYNRNIVDWANWLGLQHMNYAKTLDATAREGTLAHAHAQKLVDPENGAIPELADPLTEYYVKSRMRHFKEKIDQYEGRWKTIYTEHPMVSHTYEIGGTMDWYAEWDGVPTLFDFKTSKGVRDKHLLQLGGYRLMMMDNDLPVEQAGIIIIGRDFCRFSIFDIDTIKLASEWFLKVHEWYKIHQKLDEMMLDRNIPYLD